MVINSKMKRIKGDKPTKTAKNTPIFGLNHKPVYNSYDFLTKGWAVKLRILITISYGAGSARYTDIYRAYQDTRKTNYVLTRMKEDGLIYVNPVSRRYDLTEKGVNYLSAFKSWVKTFNEDPTSV